MIVLDLMTLEASEGTELEFRGLGADAVELVAAVAELVATGFNEER